MRKAYDIKAPSHLPTPRYSTCLLPCAAQTHNPRLHGPLWLLRHRHSPLNFCTNCLSLVSMNYYPEQLPPGYRHRAEIAIQLPANCQHRAASVSANQPPPKPPPATARNSVGHLKSRLNQAQRRVDELRAQSSNAAPVPDTQIPYFAPTPPTDHSELSTPFSTQLDQIFLGSPPDDFQPHFADMFGLNSPAPSMDATPHGSPHGSFQGGQGIVGYIATPQDLERQRVRLSSWNFDTNAYEPAGNIPEHRRQLLGPSSAHGSPYTADMSGMYDLLSPPSYHPSYEAHVPSSYAPYPAYEGQHRQTPSSPALRGGSRKGPPEQFMARELGQPPKARLTNGARKRPADTLDENEKKGNAHFLTAMPTPPLKKQKHESEKSPATSAAKTSDEVVTVDLTTVVEGISSSFKKPHAKITGRTRGLRVPPTPAEQMPVPNHQRKAGRNSFVITETQTGSKTLVPPSRKRRPSRRATSEERDGTDREHTSELEDTFDADTTLPSIEPSDLTTVQTLAPRQPRRAAQSDTATPASPDQTTAQSEILSRATSHVDPIPDAGPSYHLPAALQSLSKALGEQNWNQFLRLVEQYVEGTLDEVELIRSQRRIFHGQNPKIESKCRRLTEEMVREAWQSRGVWNSW